MSERTFEIHPRIGVARLGNSPDEFYLSPESVGGLPIACDDHGNVRTHDDGTPQFVNTFKDSVGRIKRQAASFRLFETDADGKPREVTLDDADVANIVWTVHLANKKPIWYTFSELQGDLEFGEANSYENQHIPVNNPDVTDPEARKALMIDPGPRSIDTPGDTVDLSRYNIPEDYEHGSFPPPGSGGQQIDTLGELRMDDAGRLVALGAFGNVTGDGDISSFRGASGYWDDIADGYVTATVHLTDGTQFAATPGWLLVGSPKFAPELVNITTLYDTMYDVAVRKMDAAPDIYDGADNADKFLQHDGYTPLHGFNPDYVVNFTTQIQPIIDRMQSYRWVADIPYLNDFAHPGFDLTDASAANQENRERYFNYFRVPVLPEDYDADTQALDVGPNQLFSSEGIPLMPLNSGDNSVTNSGPIYKFETLSATQYFFLYQWSQGKFTTDAPEPASLPDVLDEASVGNCVGAPFSPGIETTWIVRNAPLYDSPMHVKVAHYDGSPSALTDYYNAHGLSPTADEAALDADGQSKGCEPGDLTKRMAIPWQADFQECTVQTPNITDATINQFADGTGIEVPPAYYVYWWPPQSPMHVVTGSTNAQDQVLDAVVSEIAGQSIIPAGQRVPYQRGIHTTQDMIDSWSRLGFVVNQSADDHYPYFVETERNFQALGQLAAQQEAARLATVKAK